MSESLDSLIFYTFRNAYKFCFSQSFRTWAPIPATMQTTKEGLWADYPNPLGTTKNQK